MKLLIIAATAVILAGCSSAPKIAAEKPQYCHTYQTIKSKNGDSVNSETTVKCTDDQVERVTSKRLGMADNCGYFTSYMKVGGKDVPYRAISCFDGRNWEIINIQ
jgi:hypothetical protein